MEENLPRTSAELNYWLESRFTVFMGPPRAWFELPMRDGSVERRVYSTHAAVGAEQQACEAVARMLQRIPEGEALFVRRRFEYNHDNRMLSVRFVFWRDDLPACGFVKPEDAPAQQL